MTLAQDAANGKLDDLCVDSVKLIVGIMKPNTFGQNLKLVFDAVPESAAEVALLEGLVLRPHVAARLLSAVRFVTGLEKQLPTPFIAALYDGNGRHAKALHTVQTSISLAVQVPLDRADDGLAGREFRRVVIETIEARLAEQPLGDLKDLQAEHGHLLLGLGDALEANGLFSTLVERNPQIAILLTPPPRAFDFGGR